MSLCSIRQSSSKPQTYFGFRAQPGGFNPWLKASLSLCSRHFQSEVTRILEEIVLLSSYALKFNLPPLSLSLAKYIGCSTDRGMWSATHQTTSLHCMTLFFLTKQIWTNWGVDKSMAVQHIVQPWGTGRHTNTFAVFVSGPVQCKSNFLPEENPNELRCCHCSTAVLVRIQ